MFGAGNHQIVSVSRKDIRNSCAFGFIVCRRSWFRALIHVLAVEFGIRQGRLYVARAAPV
jgi:hypothetical protein